MGKNNDSSQSCVLVTGGAGFIGSNLVDALLKNGDRVVVLDDLNDFYDPNRKYHNLSAHLHNQNFKFIKGDIRDKEILNDVFKNFSPQEVVHLAARAGVRPSLSQPELYFDVNVMGTLNILEAMKSHKVKNLVFASSSSVYGNRNKGPFNESDSTDAQVSPYGASKKTGELLTATYAHLYGIKTTCLRFFTVYGPRNRPDMACYLFTDAIMNGRSITMYGDGTTGRDYTYVDDIVAGIIGALNGPIDKKDQYLHEIVNLGNSSPIILKDLISLIEKNTGKKARVKKVDIQPGDVQLTFANIDKAKVLLGYNPKINMVEGLNKILDWYKTVQG